MRNIEKIGGPLNYMQMIRPLQIAWIVGKYKRKSSYTLETGLPDCVTFKSRIVINFELIHCNFYGLRL